MQDDILSVLGLISLLGGHWVGPTTDITHGCLFKPYFTSLWLSPQPVQTSGLP